MNWETFFNSAAALLTTAGLKILYAALILAVGLFLVRKILRLLEQGKLLRHLDKSVRSFLTSFSGIALRVLVVLAAAGVLGVPMASFVTVLASCGVAVGLALQGSLSNLAGGIMILIFKPFSVGDYIQASGQEGTVKDITILYTILEMADKRVVTLPNGTLTNAAVVNYSASPERRVDLEFRTAAEADLDEVTELLLETARNHALVHNEPPPFCRMIRHGEGFLVFACRFWCATEDYWTVYHDLVEAGERALRKAGILVPAQRITLEMHK